MRNSSFYSIREVLVPFLLLFLIMVLGTSGYMILEGYGLLEALYMTTITVTTVGFGEIRPLSNPGRIFTIILLVGSVSTVAYAFGKLTRYLIDGEINKFFKNRKMMIQLDKLSNHVIICGFGRNGEQACITLRNHGVPCVVVEQRDEMIERVVAENDSTLYVQGDATRDEVLEKAGIHKARALISCLPLDSDNVFIVLSARALNPGLKIISRASYTNSYSKLIKAGADNVIMPDRIGGAHMASLVSRADVIEFIDFLSGQEGESGNLEVLGYDQIPPSLQQQPIVSLNNWANTGVNVVGYKTAEGKFIVNPPPGETIQPGMRIFLLGNMQQIEKLRAGLKS